MGNCGLILAAAPFEVGIHCYVLLAGRLKRTTEQLRGYLTDQTVSRVSVRPRCPAGFEECGIMSAWDCGHYGGTNGAMDEADVV